MSHEKVADYLTKHINASSKTQAQITAEAGFPKSNVLSMIKSGLTKLPISRIPGLAVALDRPVEELFRIAMAEYEPEVLKMIEEIYCAHLTAGERQVLQRIRFHTHSKDFKPTQEQLDAIETMAKSWISG